MIHFTLIVCIAGILVYTAHIRQRERMELIARGRNPYVKFIPPAPVISTKSLLFGLLSAGIGLALFIGAIAFQGFDRDMMTFAVLFIFCGITMLVFWKLTEKDRLYARQMSEKNMEEQNRTWHAVGNASAMIETPDERQTGTDD